MRGVASKSRRSFVLIAVLVIVGASLLVATSLLFVAQTELAVSSGAGEAAQSRALAWSGLQAVMAQLGDQRSRILAGEMPRLGNEIVVYESTSRQGVARLLPVSGVSGDPTLIAEAGKLDVNRADAGTLAATTRLTPEAAQAVFDHVQSSGDRMRGIIELMRVPGGVVTAEMLSGPLDELSVFGAVPASSSSAHDVAEPCVRGLNDVLTVFTAEPLLQHDGSPRINLNVPWSDGLARQIESRFGKDVVAQVGSAFEAGAKFESDSVIVKSLRQLNVAIEDWPAVLDAFTTEAGPQRTGRLDINTAPYESLLALPGISAEQASQMVRVRPSLSESHRATVAWAVLQQIVSPEQFEVLIDRITTRCWIYRVRVAGGEVRADEPDQWLGHPMVYEAVIDLSGAQPRVVYLRDITVLEETLAIASASASRTSETVDPTAEPSS